MKKRKPKKTPEAALLPNTKKEMIKLLQNPEAMKRTMDFIKTSQKFSDNVKTIKATTIFDWEERAISILPENLNHKEEFIQQLRSFIDNFGDNPDDDEEQGNDN